MFVDQVLQSTRNKLIEEVPGCEISNTFIVDDPVALQSQHDSYIEVYYNGDVEVQMQLGGASLLRVWELGITIYNRVKLDAHKYSEYRTIADLQLGEDIIESLWNWIDPALMSVPVSLSGSVDLGNLEDGDEVYTVHNVFFLISGPLMVECVGTGTQS